MNGEMPPFVNPYMTNSHEVANDYGKRSRLDFTLTEEAEDLYMMYMYKSGGTDPVMLLEGTPYPGGDGKIAGIMPMMCPNPNVPLDAIFEQDPERFADGMRSLFYPSNIYAIKTVNFVGPTAKTRNGKNLPGMSFIDDFSPSLKAKGDPGLTAFDMIWAKAESVVKYNPAWQGFLPSRDEAGNYRSNYLPRSTISYFVRANLYNWHNMNRDDKWKNPDHAVIALKQTAYRYLIKLAMTVNPQWDRSKVRTHNDLYDPNNRPFMYDLVNAYGLSPWLTMQFIPGGKGGGGASRYAQKKRGEQKGEFKPASYNFQLYTQEVGQAAGQPVMMAPASNMIDYMNASFLPPEKLFNYMEPIDVLKALLENSLDYQWSLFIQKCLEGSDIYAALTDLFDHAENIVANNLSKYQGVSDSPAPQQAAPQQVFQPTQQQTQAYAPPQQQNYAPPPQQQANYGYDQNMAANYQQPPQSNVQMPPQQSPLMPQQPTPPMAPQQSQDQNPGGVFAPNYGQQAPAYDPASTMLPGANPAAIESQLRGNAPEAPMAPPPPAQQPDVFQGQNPYAAAVPGDDECPF